MEKKRVSIIVIAALLLITVAFLAGCIPTETPEGGEATGVGSSWSMIIFLVLIFGMFYLLMIRPQRKRQKDHQSLMQELRRGDKVVTSGGIYGVIESTSEDSIVIKVESGTTLRIARSSVANKRPR